MPLPQDTAEAGTLEPDRSSTDVILDRLGDCVERVSDEFDQWADEHAQGPGLYFVVVRESPEDFVDPMGDNRWPVEDCGTVCESGAALLEAARAVGFTQDGGIVVHDDGTIEPTMVRLRQLSTRDRSQNADLPYQGWMGARHMSALETSTRDAVFAVLTLSEEDGRMTVFSDGAFEDYLPADDRRDSEADPFDGVEPS